MHMMEHSTKYKEISQNTRGKNKILVQGTRDNTELTRTQYGTQEHTKNTGINKGTGGHNTVYTIP